jgi:murein DD-endopeptidase MepM/ murein hydrolase activator NlpD
MRLALLLAALLLSPGAIAAEITFGGEAIQGGLMIGMTEPGSAVTVDGKKVRVAADGTFLVGFGREATKATVVAVTPQGAKVSKALMVKKRQYQIDRIDGLPPGQVTPDPEALKRIKADTADLAQARADDLDRPYFESGFQWPVIGRISGVYGSQRILNGEARQPHYGVDIAAPKGTPIHAMADGVITMAHQDMFFTGKTVVIDHGHGLSSVYAHMDRIDVKVGDVVKKGEVFGAIGQTGRVTGPHTHWGVSLRTIPLDPALLVGPMPAAAAP